MNNLVKKIKYNRLPEAFLIDIVNDMNIIKQTKYKNRIFYEYNGEIVFEQELTYQILTTSYYHIWSVFEKKHGYDYDKIQLIINTVVEKYTEIRGYIPNQVIFGARLLDE